MPYGTEIGIAIRPFGGVTCGMSAILLAMFLLGVFTTLVQVTLTREAMVAFMGDEMTVGAVLAGWLADVGLGAWAARRLSGRFSSPRALRTVVCAVLTVMLLALPFQALGFRIARAAPGLALGEFMPFGRMLASVVLLFFPTCFGAGFLFPLLLRLVHAEKHAPADASSAGGALGGMYIWESAGSLAGGIIATFLLIPFTSQVRMLAVSCAPVLLAAAVIDYRRQARMARAALALTLCAAAAIPGMFAQADRAADLMRWRAFGILKDSGRSMLCASKDSIYQNLAVIRTDSQYALYADGRIQSAYPAVAEAEFKIHSIMAQKPRAKRILLLGGNWASEIPELLKYPGLESITHVELDPAAVDIMRPFTTAITNDADRRRVTLETADAWRYVNACRDRFDIIVLNAPPPLTGSANRFYTVQFNRALSARLEPDGFLHASLAVSERLQARAADLGASVYKTLKAVFPVVLVTAGGNARFYAGGAESGLTFDAAELERRSASIPLRTEYFKPAYFGATDEMDPAKTAATAARFNARNVPLNTIFRPVSYFYNIMLWSNMSDSRAERILDLLSSAKATAILSFPLLVGVACLAAGVAMRLRNANAGTTSAWIRKMTAVFVVIAGFSGMAQTIILVFAFQNTCGYVYSRIGLITAVFMLGLVAGGASGRSRAADPRRRQAPRLLLVGIVMSLVPLLIPPFLLYASLPGTARMPAQAVEFPIYLLVAVSGLLVGGIFAPASRLCCENGASPEGSASATGACENIGAAAGSLLAGAAIIPILGIGRACVLLCAVNCAAVLCMLSAAILTRRKK